MINKPKKKEVKGALLSTKRISVIIYNQTCDSWEKWLKENKQEMIDMQTGLRHSVVILKENE